MLKRAIIFTLAIFCVQFILKKLECVFQQTIGILMGTNCASLLAYLQETEFRQRLIKDLKIADARSLNFTSSPAYGVPVDHVCKSFQHSLELTKHVYNHTPGPCKIVPGAGIGYEDMETLPNGLTLITSGLFMPSFSSKMKEYAKQHNVKGRIYLFDFNQPDKGIEELQIVGDQFNQSDFVPHGIGLWHDNTDKVIVLVVNHGTTGDTIEKFQYINKNKQLLHLQTFRDPAIHFVNDVAMDSETSFYFTNYAYYMATLPHFFEMLWPLRYGNLMYYDGKTFHKQDDGFITTNGVIVSRDQKYVYMFESLEKKFHIYTIQKNGTVTNRQTVGLPSVPDNPTLDKDGNILIGTHPIAWKIFVHMDNPELSVPSQVLKLHMKDGALTKVTELLSDDGHTLHGSSVASMYQDGMLVGTVLHKLLYCKVLYAE